MVPTGLEIAADVAAIVAAVCTIGAGMHALFKKS